MTPEENKALLRHVNVELYEKQNLDVIDEYYAPDFSRHSAPRGAPPGRAGLRQSAQEIAAAFSDTRLTFEDQIAEGDKVASRITIRQTHTGDFMGIPATGKRVSFSVIGIARVENGKIQAGWALVDMLGLLGQLGALDAPGPSGQAPAD